jgi:DNA-directed RNA polymerase sigma subunit (sigma70/sigma32)
MPKRNYEYKPMMTYAEIGAKFGLTASAIQLIEKKAMQKVEKILERRHITARDII